MRDFNEVDKKKKKTRIDLPENPANLSPEVLTHLEEAVNTGLKDGYLPCPVAWTIARNADVPRIAVGAITDKLDIRITNCQIGCFKVDKTLYSDPPLGSLDKEIIDALDTLVINRQLTCEKVFELSKKHNQKPMTIGNEASARNIKIRQCQLGCF